MLSKNEIHDISAGRALDKLVAEIIFGWESIGQWDHIDENDEMVVDDDDWFGVPPNAAKEFYEGKRRSTIEPLPYYSTLIEDSEIIIEHLCDSGYDFSLQSLLPMTKFERNKGFKWQAIFYDLNDMEPCISDGVGYVNHVITDVNDQWQWPAKGETIPLAIVRAGLMTVISKQIKEGKTHD